MRLRRTAPEDLPRLKALWALGFGDTEAEIDTFFTLCYPDALGFCAEEGQLIAAAYALPQTLVQREQSFRAAYVYAVTTHPDFRRQGVCRALLGYVEKTLRKRYFDVLTLFPATDALRAYYAEMGFVSQKSLAITQCDAPAARGFCETLTPQDYAGLRETLLYDVPHVRHTLPELRYQQTMTGFYRLELGPHYGCACARLEGQTLLVQELLPDASVLPALVRALGGKTCRVCTPGNTALGGMCKWLHTDAVPAVYLALRLE